jgi:hypothetical protein
VLALATDIIDTPKFVSFPPRHLKIMEGGNCYTVARERLKRRGTLLEGEVYNRM